jgi:hypothetical protein
MSYELALKAAGADVIDTHYAGSYQGTWGSVVIYNGKKGLVTGSFGSCSYCDAFQSEFENYSWGSHEISYNAEKDVYTKDYGDTICTKEEYDAQQLEYQEKLSAFGQRYLHVVQDKFDVENQLANSSKDDWWDEERHELLNWALPLL